MSQVGGYSEPVEVLVGAGALTVSSGVEGSFVCCYGHAPLCSSHARCANVTGRLSRRCLHSARSARQYGCLRQAPRSQ